MTQDLKIRIICDGWYDTELGRSYAAGAVVSGSRISGRLLTALKSGETYRDRSGRELPVCEEAVLTFRDLPVIVAPAGKISNVVPVNPFPDVEPLSDSEEKEIKFIDPDSDAGDSVMPIRVLEARMSVEGVKVVDLGIRKTNDLDTLPNSGKEIRK